VKTLSTARPPLVAGIVVLGLFIGLPLAAQTPPREQLDELETVVVTGEHPGPGLWRVSHGDHVMWVLASYEPLPKDLIWRSKSVEARIGESQQVLYPPAVKIDDGIGFLSVITLIPTMFKTMLIPDSKTLQDVLPADTYRKWLLLCNKYQGKQECAEERLRPMFAIMGLRDAALQKGQLKKGSSVDAIVKAAANKRHVRVQHLSDVKLSGTVKVKRDDLRSALTNVRDMPDVPCFTQSLDHMEAGIALLKSRANAWALGNIDALRNLNQEPDIGTDCDDPIQAAILAGGNANSARFKELDEQDNRLRKQGKEQAQLDWIAAARKALDKNRSTFAVLPIHDVVSATGYLAELKALGYEVEEPHSASSGEQN
jgi:TraB/PrgY/gumN family